MANGEVLDLGGKRVRHLDTPHVPHGWEAGLLFDDTTGTLFCGDLFTRWGAYPGATADALHDLADGLDARIGGPS